MILAELAARQWDDYRALTPGTYFAEPGAGMDLAAAYRLQDAVTALRLADGDRAAGYKVGCTGPGTVAQFGMTGPIRGRLFGRELRRSGDTVPHARFYNLAIEGEMALRIGADGEAVAAFPVIELHHFVFRAPTRTLAELVANNGLQAGVVLPGEPWMASTRYLTANGSLDVSVNGERLDASGLWPLPGGAQASLAWLRDHLHGHGAALVPGDIVLAGTPLGLYPVRPGDHIVVGLDGEPVTQCRVA